MTKRAKKNAGCDCVHECNKLLAARNTKLVAALSLSGGPTIAVLATGRINNLRDGKRASTVLASFCPICGKKYPARKNEREINLIDKQN